MPARDALQLVFDLDDTLYLERDFARSGFAAAGAWIATSHGLEGFGPLCQALFDRGRRADIFDEALRRLGRPADPALVAALVGVYRGHRPLIALAADAARYLERRRGFSAALITDGPAAMQRAKVEALGLGPAIGLAIYTDALGEGFGKPHPRGFEAVEAWSGRGGDALVYVADNPAKDFVTPRARGWLTVRIARPGRIHLKAAPDAAHEAHATIDSLDALDDCLDRLATSRSRPTARRVPA